VNNVEYLSNCQCPWDTTPVIQPQVTFSLEEDETSTSSAARNAVDGCRSDEWRNGDFRIFTVLTTVPLAQLVDYDALHDHNADLAQQLSGRLRASWLQMFTNFALTQRISIYHRRIQGVQVWTCTPRSRIPDKFTLNLGLPTVPYFPGSPVF